MPKMKTKRAAAKRFDVTGSGKFRRRKQNLRHILTKKPGLMMASIYRTLLREIESDQFQVLHQRISLTPLRKLWLAWRVQALGKL